MNTPFILSLKKRLIFPFLFMIVVLSVFPGCVKTDAPVTTSIPVLSTPLLSNTTTSAISITEATVSGRIISNGGSPVSTRGICWGMGPSPTIDSNKIADLSNTDSFSVRITGLNSGTLYYVRAYAANSVGIW